METNNVPIVVRFVILILVIVRIIILVVDIPSLRVFVVVAVLSLALVVKRR